MNNKNTLYDSIDPVDQNPMIVTWDTGKRCNFDCGYCGADRHDNFSPFPSYETLISGVDFLKEYLSVMLPYRAMPAATISLTGGEPTANPSFIKFAEYLNEQFLTFDYDVNLSVTTNGTYPEKNIEKIAKLFNSMTLSYHCDGDQKIKERVRSNIIKTNLAMKSFRVNLMMHPYDPYWKECHDLIEVMKESNVRFVPRVINGLEYSEEQSQWFKDYWNQANNGASKTTIEVVAAEKPKGVIGMATEEVYTGRHMKKDVAKIFKTVKGDPTKHTTITGRHCCNKIDLDCGLKGTESKERIQYLGDTNFKDWYCSVNWFFLHLESQTDQIFHHQTCQAQYGQGRGPVGKISEWKTFVEEVRGYLENRSMPTIKCPNRKCACGLCATKSSSFVKFVGLTSRHTNGVNYKYDG
jgi:organic radical activating enzyme